MKSVLIAVILYSLGSLFPAPAQADEQFFGFARGAETLPGGHGEVYQFVTLRTGKDTGVYYGSDYETEFEYGFTDKFQAGFSLVNHYFNNHDVGGLPNRDNFRFGGFEISPKYRLLSPFKDLLVWPCGSRVAICSMTRSTACRNTNATQSRSSICKRISSMTD